MKLADEMTELGFDPPSLRYGRARNPIPDAFAWSERSSKSGDDFEVYYRHPIESLGKDRGQAGNPAIPRGWDHIFRRRGLIPVRDELLCSRTPRHTN